MLRLSDSLENVPIMSLQTGTKVAHSIGVVIDPATLAIPALYVEGQGIDQSSPSVLFTQDIREVSDIGFIVDSSEQVMKLDGLVRLQSIISEDINLIDTVVAEQSGKKIGTVIDFSYDSQLFIIQQILVRPPLWRRLLNDERIIHRSHIINVTKDLITIDSSTASHKVKDGSESIINPFLSPDTESTPQ